MPAVSAPATVLVTGASGFVAAHVVKAHIDRGFIVRGTVRKPSRGEYLKNLFGDKFEYVIVDDMTLPNAYDKAVVGVDAVQHTASPVAFEQGDPDIIIKPAVNGTLNILESVKNFGPTVKRIVITSSIVAIGDDTADTLYETQWHDTAVDAVNEQGIAAHPGYKYAASKVLAERAAWQFVEVNKAAINFDFVTVCPPWIWGPMIHEGRDATSINTSMGFVLAGLDPKNEKTGEELTKKGGDLVDVRDVGIAHALLLENEKAGGERVLVDARSWSWQSLYDAANEAPAVEGVPVGQPGTAKEWPASSSTKFCELVGKSRGEFYRPTAETIKSALESGRARGFGEA